MHFRPSRPANCGPTANPSGRGSSPFARPFGHTGSVSRSGSHRNRPAPLALQSALTDRVLPLLCAPLPVASVQALVSLSLPRRKHCEPLQTPLLPFFRHDRTCCSRGQELWSFDKMAEAVSEG